MTSTEDVFRPSFDLGEFRYAVARYVKLLIRARWKCDPDFLTKQELVAWELSDVGKDRQPTWKLLGQAAQALGHLNDQFLPRCGSGGTKETDTSTPVGRLIDAAACLAQIGDGGGPWHNGALLEAARRLRDGRAVDWDDLVDWSLLPAIRADLDLLPHPKPEDTSERLERVESLLASLVEREQVKDFYSTEEFGKLVDKAEFTVREWCRLGRIKAIKKTSGRGKHQGWAISHEELLRFRKEGLLPQPR